MSVLEDLIGKKITSLWVNNDTKGHLVFMTDSGEQIGFGTYGDCCSHTWFHEILGVPYLIDSEIRGVIGKYSSNDYESHGVDGGPGTDVVVEYGHTLVTDKGYVDIIFRNDSNGYYGGSIERSSPGISDGHIIITKDWESNGNGRDY